MHRSVEKLMLLGLDQHLLGHLSYTIVEAKDIPVINTEEIIVSKDDVLAEIYVLAVVEIFVEELRIDEFHALICRL